MSENQIELASKVLARCLPCYVVLGLKEGGNAYEAVIENSWSMGTSRDRACIFFTGPYCDGKETAEHYKKYFNTVTPGTKYEIFDVLVSGLPITIDWTQWDRDNEPVKDSLSGVRNKFLARNAKFSMKEG